MQKPYLIFKLSSWNPFEVLECVLQASQTTPMIRYGPGSMNLVLHRANSNGWRRELLVQKEDREDPTPLWQAAELCGKTYEGN